MNKATLSFGGLIAVIAAILFGLQMNSAPKAPPPTIPDAGQPAPASPVALPPLARLDASGPPPVIDLEYIQHHGLVNQEIRWLDEGLPKRDWRRLPDEGAWPTFMAFEQIKVSWKVEKGRIVGALIDLPDNAFGATLAGLTPPFYGQGGHLPHLEDIPSPAEGEFETPGGTMKYRCEMNNNAPSGPKRCDFDLIE
ncbi:hypothetical protein KKF91_13520 [Myxococcota bacterium]|nr:hypothetical protein [Myxococcota bacterium]MBU1431556.1 hypothetical protein [Myxococcota bacterium]MBU1898758.1 hypothetical protein [Myxococcota bacterium]